MADHKIEPETVDWRLGLTGVSSEEHRAFRLKVFDSIASFKDLRKKLGLTQVDVAERLNMTQANVSKIEARSMPTLETLKSVVEGKGRVRVLVELEDGEVFEFSP